MQGPTVSHKGECYLRCILQIFALGDEKSPSSPFQLMWNERIDRVDYSLNDIGLAVIYFLRMLSSQQFSMAQTLDLSLYDGRPMPYPIILRQQHWEPLHQVSDPLYVWKL